MHSIAIIISIPFFPVSIYFCEPFLAFCIMPQCFENVTILFQFMNIWFRQIHLYVKWMHIALHCTLPNSSQHFTAKLSLLTAEQFCCGPDLQTLICVSWSWPNCQQVYVTWSHDFILKDSVWSKFHNHSHSDFYAVFNISCNWERYSQKDLD